MPVITNPWWEDIALFEKPTKLASPPWTIFAAAAKDEAAEAARLRSVLSKGFDFAENLENLMTEITEAEHAEVLCEAVEKMAQRKAGAPRVPLADFRAIVRQYHRVINHKLPAYQVLRQRGMASLVKLYDQQLLRSDSLESDLALMEALLVFAKFGSREGERRILNALYGELGCELKYWELKSADWSIYKLRYLLPAEILRTMFMPPVASEEFFNELRANPPSRMLAFQLLEVANGDVFRSGDPRIHPFNSPWGAEFLSYWLNGLCSATPDPKVVAELREYESSLNQEDLLMRPLVGTLRYVSPEIREQLLPVAMRHPDPEIQIYAAAIAAEFGNEAGWKLLQYYALDLQYGAEAFSWFRELRREDLLPLAARNSEFRLKASFAGYSDMRSILDSNGYYDRFPDQIKVIDQRKLDWPLEAGPKMVTIVGFVIWDKYGLGAEWTGLAVAHEELSWLDKWAWDTSDSSMGRPFEDAYAIACCDSLCCGFGHTARLTNQLPPGIDYQDIDSPSVRAELLKQWRGQALDPSKSLVSLQVDPALELPVRQYVAVEGKMNGVEGWAVLAGDEVAWYPKDEQPEHTDELTILKLHVGRLLLGFEEQPDRKAWLERKYFQRRPEEIVAIYERLMAELPAAEEERREELMDSEGPLAIHFEQYIAALLITRGGSRGENVIATIEQMLRLPLNDGESAFWGPGEVAAHFDTYVQALISTGRERDAIAAIKLCLKHQRSFSNDEIVRFGLEAYQARRLEVAELWFEYAADLYFDWWYRQRHVSQLAEILQQRGEQARAKSALIDCLKMLSWDIRDTESEQERAELLECYRYQRAAYLRLFPNGADELNQKKLPETPPMKEIDKAAD